MIASSFGDPILGIDIHWEMIPTPAPVPMPIPNPFTGIVFDPIGLAVGVAISGAMSAVTGAPFQGPVIYWGAFPATNTGTEGKHIPGHIMIPPGTAWAPVPRTPKPVIRPGETPDPPKPISPDNDAIAIFGSKTVTVMGSNAVRLGDIFLSCSEPIRLPSSVVLAIPKGALILIGGPPSLDIAAAVMASLRTRFMSDSLHSLVSRLSPGRFRNFLHRAVCFFTGHPVDVASGKVLTECVDAALPGPLPLQIDRIYSSAFADRAGRVGQGWSISLDQAVWRERGKVVLRSEDGREIEFDTFDLPGHRIEPGQSLCSAIERLTLRCLPDHAWEIEDADGVVRRFQPVAGDRGQAGALGPVARIESMRDRTGHHRNSFHYDARGCLEWVRDATGRLIQLEHDAEGRLIVLRLPRAQGEGWLAHRTYRYDEAGDLVEVQDATGAAWRYEYSTHLLTRETDRSGFSYYFVYDGFGADAWCTRTWGEGGVFDHELIYDKNQRVTFVTDSLGNTSEYRMNVAGMVIEVRDPLGASRKYSYDPITLARSEIIDPDGKVTKISYDSRGSITRFEGPDGSASSFEYDDKGALRRAVDAIGGVWQWRYDSLGQVVESSNPLGQVTQYGWAKGLPAWIRRPDGRWITYEHDERGQLRVIKDGAGNETQLSWDNLGQQTRLHEVGGAKLSFYYDAEGRLIELARPSGERQRRAYDADGHLVAVHDARLDVRLHYSPDHHVIAREEQGWTQRFEYDTEGRMIARVDVAGNRHELVRDGAGRVVVERRPDGAEQHYSYDAHGRIVELESPAKRKTTMKYDVRGRLIEVERPDGFCKYAYRPDGALMQAINERGMISFERDALGRILREEQADAWVQSRYGADGRVAIQSSLGLVQELFYDPAGAVARIELGVAARRSARSRFEFQRDGSGHERARRGPGNVGLRWQRDDRSRPIQRTTLRNAAAAPDEPISHWEGGAEVVEERRFHWQGEDRLIALEDLQRGRVTHYDYDALGRVVRERRPEKTIERAQDPQGNVYRRPDMLDRQYVGDGQLTATSTTQYGYDEDGQRVRRVDADGTTWEFSYDGQGLLRAIERSDGQRIEYEYDALGRRIRKLRSGGNERYPDEDVRYVWDGRRILHESRGSDDSIDWYWSPHDPAPIAKRQGDRLWSIVADHMGNPTEMYDEQGQLCWQAQLDVYGHLDLRQGAPDDCPWRWPGQYEDSDAQLHYNGFRYYDPSTGAYTTRDPLGLVGNDHPYAYPANPWAWSDPLGLVQSWDEFAERANAWNTGEGAATPMSDSFMQRAWSLYHQTFKGTDRPVIGDFGDVARFIDRNGSGWAKLSLPMPPSTGFHWNTFVNDQWMQAFIDKRATVYLASEPTEALLKSAEFGRSVFGREMDQLTAAGYRLMGKLGDKKNPLRMEPPCH